MDTRPYAVGRPQDRQAAPQEHGAATATATRSEAALTGADAAMAAVSRGIAVAPAAAATAPMHRVVVVCSHYTGSQLARHQSGVSLLLRTDFVHGVEAISIRAHHSGLLGAFRQHVTRGMVAKPSVRRAVACVPLRGLEPFRRRRKPCHSSPPAGHLGLAL